MDFPPLSIDSLTGFNPHFVNYPIHVRLYFKQLIAKRYNDLSNMKYLKDIYTWGDFCCYPC